MRGANPGWRFQFRYRGSRPCSRVPQLVVIGPRDKDEKNAHLFVASKSCSAERLPPRGTGRTLGVNRFAMAS